jgi:transcriptional regulator with XRE-family HTH domain
MGKFGKELRKARNDSGKTMGDVADHIGCAVSYVSDVELGHRKPFKTEQVVKIARFLKCDAARLVALATAERGAVSITTQNPNVQNIAQSLARSGDKLSQGAIEQIEAILREDEEKQR